MTYRQFMAKNFDLLRQSAILSAATWASAPKALAIWIFEAFCLPIIMCVVFLLSLVWFPARALITLFPGLALKPKK